ncbi:hypothetical protein H2508_00725 [Parahaliea sp. F7430]|uniref:Uncharacterized protein n=1 Tax=Sediminihaliea albiluteola TaxID=2758564 RepID=A0A7W2TTN2_9GAMM|nr:hypothetical protein [Sediminihaliea albiluteola]MBA6411643.1 hypothetical protein [Sediminihaliea albiluteola]
MIANITLPRILKIGAGASAELLTSLQELGYKRPFVVTDPLMLAQQAIASGSPANNPRIPQQSDMVAFYQRVWGA